MRLYNTLTKKVEQFKPQKGKTVSIYTCGPTVYDYAHIGNLRAYVVWDVLERSLERFGFKVKRVMNITDVGHLSSDQDEGEDKIEKGARREGKSAWEIAKFYEQTFFEDLAKLNVRKPAIIPKATEHINEQIDFIKRLEKKGYTYKTSDGVYFNTALVKDYGKLTGQDLEALLEGARVEKNPEKKNAADFALWKFSPKGKKRDMEWESPWGKGFPGWHIECSAMAMKYLGETLDIHAGGVDHIPIHHTNEIAQSEAATGKPMARFFIHNEFLLIGDSQKMSKSQGNFLTLKSIEKEGVLPLAYRYLVLTAHYRDKLKFSWQALRAAESALNSLYVFAAEQKSGGQSSYKLARILREARERFDKALKNDLNTPQALAAVWEFKKEINRLNIKSEKVFNLLSDFDRVLGLNLLEKVEKGTMAEIPPDIESLVLKRESARNRQEWKLADELREKIKSRGYELLDTSEGVKLVHGSQISFISSKDKALKEKVGKGVDKVVEEYGDVLKKLNKE